MPTAARPSWARARAFFSPSVMYTGLRPSRSSLKLATGKYARGPEPLGWTYLAGLPSITLGLCGRRRQKQLTLPRRSRYGNSRAPSLVRRALARIVVSVSPEARRFSRSRPQTGRGLGVALG